jgi:dTDP-4-amino-4,6-dideoxygalactose transaminase
LHLHPFYRKKFGFKKGDFPNSEWVYEREVSLPLYPKMSKEDIFRVISVIKKIIKEA